MPSRSISLPCLMRLMIPSASTLKHYIIKMYGFLSKLVCLSNQVKVTDNIKDSSLLLTIHYKSEMFFSNKPCYPSIRAVCTLR
jgi:hypothetical protein